MSAASRKNDPFHFDEIYKQAGVEDLFVKKTLGELKQKQTAPGPAPASSPARPAPQAPAPKPVSNAANFDLDFLSTIAKPAGATPNAPKHSSTPNLLASAGVQQPPKPQPQQPAGATSRQQPADDPFALFHEVPGAAPAQRHTPPPAPRPQPPGGTGFLLDFDDGNAFFAAPVPPAVPAPTSSPSLAPVSGGGPHSAVAPPRLVMDQPAPASSRPEAPPAAAQPAPPPRPPQPAPPPAPAASPAAAPPPPPPPDYAFHEEHQPAPAPLSYGSTDPRGSSFGATAWAHAPPRDYGSTGSYVATHDSHPGVGYVPAASEPSNSSSTSFTWNHTPSNSGISGMLKAFGKKAVRAAKAGLAQLEHALEGIEQPAGQQQQQGGGQQHSQYQPPQGSGRSSRGRSQDGDADVDHDHALAWAVRLADMPPHAQQQELSQMAPPLRRKVIEVLREQIRVEHEAGSLGVLGHGHAPGAAAPGPELPSYGHGYGGPLPHTAPVPHPGGPPQERASGHPPAAGREWERERPSPNGVLGPVSAGVAVRAAPGVAQGAQVSQPEPQQDAHAAHDLLGMSSGAEVPPAPVSGTRSGIAAAPAPVPAVPVAIVDDLLGIDDDEGPSRHRQTSQQATAAKPAAPAASAPAAAVAPPAVVHVDDIDDFFSGGTSSGKSAAAAAKGPAPAAASVALHGSSSAPNIGGGRGAVSGGSSAAALADMLLHDDDVIGGAGGSVNVDVSGYEELYRGEQGMADEPELRKRLRAQREAAKHAKMKAALAEKKAMEADEAARREAQVVLKDQYKADIEAWKNKHKGNIRGLLVTLQTVLWPDSGWVPVGVGDLLEPVQIKKVYMRANLLVHPDKVRQRNGTPEQVAIADMVFDVLKDAWNIFR